MLRDPEVLKLLGHEPELLAIADTIYATLGADHRRRQRLLRTARVGALAIVLATVAGLALLAPWRAGERGVVAQALAAVPVGGPVVHTVVRTELPSAHLIDLANGREAPSVVELEFWFDPRKNMLHALIRRDQVIVGDLLLTPREAVSAAGRIVGSHEGRTLSPALIGFATGYHRALQDRAARPVGRALLDNQQVTTLEIQTRFGREQVALDPQTLRPLAIRTLAPKATELTARVIAFAMLPTSDANFHRPHETQTGPTGGTVVASILVSPAEAARALSRPSMWVGRRFRHLELRLVERQQLERFYASSAKRRRFGVGIDLIYGAVRGHRPDWRGSFLEITQATRPEPAYGFLSGALSLAPTPRTGTMRLERLQMPSAAAGAIWRAQLQSRGLYVTITGASRTIVLAAAQTLTPISRQAR